MSQLSHTPTDAFTASEAAADVRIARSNQQLQGASAHDILRWTLEQSERAILSTSFGPHSAVLLKLATDVRPDIPVIWVDTGYNTAETYRFAERLIGEWNLNIHIYQPARTAARINAVIGDVTDVDGRQHKQFTDEVKLEPFRRALAEHRPDFWITGVRRSETAFRKTLRVVEPGPGDVTKIAPLLQWSDTDVEDYIDTHGLPVEDQYHDVTKVMAQRECGLHCRL